MDVIANEGKAGNPCLSTCGHAGTAFRLLTHIESKLLHFGDSDKLAALCGTFLKYEPGHWISQRDLDELLYEPTA